MARTSFRDKLIKRAGFVVLAELTGGPGFSYDPIEKFLTAYREKGDSIPAEFDFAAIALPQSPGGVANIEPASAIEFLQAEELLVGLDVVPHVTCKDMNADAIISSLMSLRKSGIESVLALTGDKPVRAAGVFELESLGLLRLIKRINMDAYLQARPQALDAVRTFYPGAAVSPFKYSEASQMQQYYKMEKKIACGAEFLITQVGWDWRKSLELFTYLKETGLVVPVFGNVYLLSTLTPAPRLMHDIKLPGCFVSDELLARVRSERVEAHLERAAQQVAMYRAMGAAGVDIGGLHDFDMFARILRRAAEIGSGWEQFKDNLCWPPRGAERTGGSVGAEDSGDDPCQGRPALESRAGCPSHDHGQAALDDATRIHSDEVFYLYDESGRRTRLVTPYPTFGKRFFDFSHRVFLDPKHVGFRAFRRTMSFLGAQRGRGAIYKLFNSGERAFKYLAFECEECGDCFLPENFGLCTIGGCEKGMDNAPCGDATVDGRCGNNLDRVCIGERIYEAAASEGDRGRAEGVSPSVRGQDARATGTTRGLERLRTIVNKPRNPALEHTSSIINYLFGRDHTMKSPLISIGEAIHASIPKTGRIMKELLDNCGVRISECPAEKAGPQLEYIRALIESQADEGADYIAINLDAFGEDDPQLAVEMMVEYVRLVRRWGRGVPVCIDSSSNDILSAGLKEWYRGTTPVGATPRGCPSPSGWSQQQGQPGQAMDGQEQQAQAMDGQEPQAQAMEGQQQQAQAMEGQQQQAQAMEGQARGPAPTALHPPLLNSVKVYTMDQMLPLKKDYDFSFIGLLVSEDKPTGPGGSHSVDELYGLARQIFERATGRSGFEPGQIFFDSTVFPLAIDMPMEPGVPGYTYRTFETIRRIRSDPQMKGAHCSLGISNSVRDLPARRVGVCRAYVAKAMEYGLDAGIVNTAHQYGSVEPDPALLELVDAYAHLDGSAERTAKAMELMARFCRDNRKAN